MSTPSTWVLGRTELLGGDQAAADAVTELQNQMRLQPLSTWPQPYNPPQGQLDPSVNMTDAPPAQVAAMAAPDFFNKLCALMNQQPPAPADAAALQRFATIGITPGGNVDGLDEKLLSAAAEDALYRISGYVDPQARMANGWMFLPDVGIYGTSYDLRAYVAMTGLGANLPQDALYPTIVIPDAVDRPHRFSLHFESGRLPPVNAFWSITAYDADSFLIANDATSTPSRTPTRSPTTPTAPSTSPCKSTIPALPSPPATGCRSPPPASSPSPCACTHHSRWPPTAPGHRHRCNP